MILGRRSRRSFDRSREAGNVVGEWEDSTDAVCVKSCHYLL